MRLTRPEAELSQGLDRAAAARRDAAKRQDRAKFLCIECHGPDGEHTSECDKRKGQDDDSKIAHMY